MEFSARTIAEFLKGEIIGDPEVQVSGVAKIEEATEGTLSFYSNPRYEAFVYTTKASILIVNRDFEPSKEVRATLIKVDDAYQALASLLQLQESMKPQKTGIHVHSAIEDSTQYGEAIYVGAYAYIGEHCKLGHHVKVYPQVYIGDHVEIGDHTVIYPGAKIYHGCKIGSHCVIHSGAVIGSDGFGFAPSSENNYNKIPQVGNVILHDYVEVGANTTIDRATMGSTVIRKGAKLDNLIQIGHNVEVGENTVMAAQTGIAGSTKIGKNCMFGGQVGITGHVSIADNVKAAAQSGIAAGIKEEGLIVMGAPAYGVKDYNRSYVYFRKLPGIVARLEAVEKSILKRTDPGS